MPDLRQMLWFDLSPKSPKEWGEQPAELWLTAVAYQNAYRAGESDAKGEHDARQDLEQENR